MSAKLLAELLPLGRRLHPTVVRRQVQVVAARLEDELGEERSCFIDTCQREREELPRPELPLTVGLDGGYVHSSQQRSRRGGWFEVIVGKAIPAKGRPTYFGYMQTYSLHQALHDDTVARSLDNADRDWLLQRIGEVREELATVEWTLGRALIHGDAWAGNLLRTPNTAHGHDGVLLGDGDRVSHGLREVDLVPTWHAVHRYGKGPGGTVACRRDGVVTG